MDEKKMAIGGESTPENPAKQGVFAMIRNAPETISSTVPTSLGSRRMSGRFFNLNALAGPLRRVRDRFQDFRPVGTA